MSQNITLDSTSNRLIIEAWIKIWEGKGNSNTGEIFRIERIMRVRLGILGMQVLIGEEPNWRNVNGFKINYREWT